MLDYETLKKTKIFGEQTVAARSDVIAKNIASGLFQNRSGRPEDWTVSARVISSGHQTNPFSKQSVTRLKITRKKLSEKHSKTNKGGFSLP